MASGTFRYVFTHGKSGIGRPRQCLGTGSFVFSDEELKAAGLPIDSIRAAYQVIAQRIGISGEGEWGLGSLEAVQPALKLDANAQLIRARYRKRKSRLHQKGLVLERTPLALLTQGLGNRQETTYREMEFWDDHGLSAYRPWITINQLRHKQHFRYQGQIMVLRFEESEGVIFVYGRRMDTHEPVAFQCRKLILCASALGTARIVLRSGGAFNHKIPLICNPYCYIPTLQWAARAVTGNEHRSGFSQLSLYYDPIGNQTEVSIANLYTYRSLLLFRLIKEMPLNYRLGRLTAQILQRMLVIAGIHHPEWPSQQKHIQLVQDTSSPTGDHLEVAYALSRQEAQQNRKRERTFKHALRSLGCVPLKTVFPGAGASVHYAGTIPFFQGNGPAPALTIASNGVLGGTQRVFVADGAGFHFLPGKGLTLTLMAYAHHVALTALESA